MFVSCVYVVLSCVGRGVCEGLITRLEESYRVSNSVLLGNKERKGGEGLHWTVQPTEERSSLNHIFYIFASNDQCVFVDSPYKQYVKIVII
jgi:hypothetical protein